MTRAHSLSWPHSLRFVGWCQRSDIGTTYWSGRVPVVRRKCVARYRRPCPINQFYVTLWSSSSLRVGLASSCCFRRKTDAELWLFQNWIAPRNALDVWKSFPHLLGYRTLRESSENFVIEPMTNFFIVNIGELNGK